MQTTVVGVAAFLCQRSYANEAGNSSIDLSQNLPSSLEYPASDEMQGIICGEGGF